MGDWDGKERRATSADILEIRELLYEIKTQQELHLEEEKKLRPKVEELVTILERSKGVVTFLKVCIYVGTPVAAFAVWAKDHIKF